MNNNIINYNYFPTKKFLYFFLSLFVINLITSIFLTFSNFSVLKSLILTIFIFIISIFCFFEKKNKENLYFFSIVLLAIVFWGFLFYPHLNTNDDLAAYLVFSEKTVVNGNLPIEPLSTRRMYSLGGLYPFQGALSYFNLKFLSLIEPTLGILLISTATVILSRNFFSKIIILTLLILSPLLGSRILANTTGIFFLVFYSYINLFCFSYLLKKENLKKQGYLIGIIVLSIAMSLAIKPITFIFNILIFFLIIFYLIFFIKFKTKYFNYILLSIFFSIIYLFPFLKASYLSSGTLVYPFLGGGWGTSNEIFNLYSEITKYQDILKYLLFFFKDPLFLFSVFLITISIIKKNNLYLDISILFSYIIFYLIIIFTVGENIPWVKRYSFPISFSIILFYLNTLTQNEDFSKYKKKMVLMTFIFALLILFSSWFYKGKEINENRTKITQLFTERKMLNDLKDISFIKTNKNKILVHGYISINFFKNGFKNMLVFDEYFQMLPWLDKKDFLNQENFSQSKMIENFYNYLKSNNINYIVNSKHDTIPKKHDLFNVFLQKKTKLTIFNYFNLHEIQ